MSFDERIEGLKAQHRDLEFALEEETNRPSPDTVAIAEMKKQKLRIKDEIAQLAGH
ncbi:YdcH family protein [Photobacterium ganghwense]|uniref:YdcH family protein n=1 Tax=Photobacterium ganghwense TaxID=320778 RepID=UPI0039F02D4C